MRDDDDRLALLAHAAQDREELLHFLRRQHGRRLVENQQLGLPVERLQQLDALLLADGKVFDHCIGIDRELEFLRQRANARGRRLQVERQG